MNRKEFSLSLGNGEPRSFRFYCERKKKKENNVANFHKTILTISIKAIQMMHTILSDDKTFPIRLIYAQFSLSFECTVIIV